MKELNSMTMIKIKTIPYEGPKRTRVDPRYLANFDTKFDPNFKPKVD